MVTVAQKFNWGHQLTEQYPLLMRRLDEAYTNLATIINAKVDRYVTSGTDAPANDPLNRNLEIGDIYVRTDTDTAWIMTSRTSDVAVTWTLIT